MREPSYEVCQLLVITGFGYMCQSHCVISGVGEGEMGCAPDGVDAGDGVGAARDGVDAGDGVGAARDGIWATECVSQAGGANKHAAIDGMTNNLIHFM